MSRNKVLSFNLIRSISFLVFFLLFTISFLLSPLGVVAQEKEIGVYLNGTKLNFDVAPKVVNSRTVVPIRGLSEALGATVNWNEDTQTINITKDAIEISLTVDSSAAIINKVTKELDSPATVINGRTFVPLRFVSESFNLDVSWDESTSTINISNTSNNIIVFPDKNLDSIIREKINKPSGNIYKKDVQGIKELVVYRDGLSPKETKIRNLSGIENLVNLEDLSLGFNDISDISYLKGLTKLKELGLQSNNISNISALSSLSNLEMLWIHGNKIDDISYVLNLPKLKYINAFNNSIPKVKKYTYLSVCEKKGIEIFLGDDIQENIVKLSNSYYENSANRYKIFLPYGWKVNDSSQTGNLMLDSAYDKELGLPRIDIVSSKNESGMSFDVAEKNLLPLMIKDLIQQENVKEVKRETVSMENQKGILIEFTGDVKVENETYKIHTYLLFTSNNSYTQAVLATSPDYLWDLYKDTLNKSLLSFRPITSSQTNKSISSLSELKAFLEANYSQLDTCIGTTKFNFAIYENTRSYEAYDYWIQVKYEYNFFEGAMSSIKYTDAQKNQLRQELKNHQENLAKAVIAAMPNKKFYGGYYDSWYKYPNLKIDLQTRYYYSWKNYDEPSYMRDINQIYNSTKPSSFRWWDFIDAKL